MCALLLVLTVIWARGVARAGLCQSVEHPRDHPDIDVYLVPGEQGLTSGFYTSDMPNPISLHICCRRGTSLQRAFISIGLIESITYRFSWRRVYECLGYVIINRLGPTLFNNTFGWPKLSFGSFYSAISRGMSYVTP